MDFFANWENKDLVSAMLSCLAVLVSFTTLIWQWRCKHPRYKISTHSASPNFIFEYNQRPAYLSKADFAMLNLQLDDLPTSARCVVFLQLANLSETAITITEAKPFIGTVILHSPIGTKKFKVQCDTIENVLKTKKSYLPKIKEF